MAGVALKEVRAKGVMPFPILLNNTGLANSSGPWEPSVYRRQGNCRPQVRTNDRESKTKRNASWWT